MRKTSTALIGNIQKFSTQDGPGIHSTIFLKGCSLQCVWCHNPEMIRTQNQMILSPSRCIRCGACMEVCPKGGITVGEDGPFIDFTACEACGACAEVCYAKAITPVATEMTVANIMETVLQDRDFYEDSGGGVTISGGEPLQHGDFVQELILDNLRALAADPRTHDKIWARMPLLHGVNDGDAEIQAVRDLLQETGVEVEL